MHTIMLGSGWSQLQRTGGWTEAKREEEEGREEEKILRITEAESGDSYREWLAH
jgi:hypothetical protein